MCGIPQSLAICVLLFPVMEKSTQSDLAPATPNVFGKRILVIDDVPLVARVFVGQLKAAGFENVTYETDGQLAMKVIREFEPNLILLDISMPEINGLDLLNQIRSDSEMDDTVVMMLSAAGRDEQAKSVELGATGFIRKPTTAAHLVKTVTDELNFK